MRRPLTHATPVLAATLLATSALTAGLASSAAAAPAKGYYDGAAFTCESSCGGAYGDWQITLTVEKQRKARFSYLGSVCSGEQTGLPRLRQNRGRGHHQGRQEAVGLDHRDLPRRRRDVHALLEGDLPAEETGQGQGLGPRHRPRLHREEEEVGALVPRLSRA